ncbi:MAG: hypothetical protein JNL93_13730 [Pelomonas sp.]|nr:hypothetical protein [Roseateles sp.]
MATELAPLVHHSDAARIPFPALLTWHVWRDAAGCCYTCACPLNGQAQPISHYKGETYLYCGPCATWHRGLCHAVTGAALVAVIAAVAAMVLAR